MNVEWKGIRERERVRRGNEWLKDAKKEGREEIKEKTIRHKSQFVDSDHHVPIIGKIIGNHVSSLHRVLYELSSCHPHDLLSFFN